MEEKDTQVTATVNQLPMLNNDTLPEWCEAAENGDAVAQYQVALYLEQEELQGEETERYLYASAKQGYLPACYELGKRLKEKEDAAAQQQAVQWLRQGAEGGHAQSAKELALCYLKGIGSAVDFQQADVWFCRWAELEGSEAMFQLAMQYAQGTLLPKRMGKAMALVYRAEQAGMAEAREQFSAQYRAWKEQQDTPEQLYQKAKELEKNSQQAQDLYLQAAKMGYAPAQVEVGTYLEAQKRPEEALIWYGRAAKQGERKATFKLGYYFGSGIYPWIRVDLDRAVFWSLQAMERGEVVGTYNAAVYYRKRSETEDSNKISLALHLKASQENYENSMGEIGYRYYHGIQVEQDYVRARYWFERGSASDGFSCYYLWFMYREGIGTETDLNQAVQYLIASAQKGFKRAQEVLADCYANGEYVQADAKKAEYWKKQANSHG